jgi:hypothetical protein
MTALLRALEKERALLVRHALSYSYSNAAMRRWGCHWGQYSTQKPHDPPPFSDFMRANYNKTLGDLQHLDRRIDQERQSFSRLRFRVIGAQ